MSIQEYRDPTCSVFVGNLESSVEEASVVEEVLWELFLQAGPLKSVHLPRTKDTGIPKKFAFVEFEHDISVAYACELLNGVNLFGRAIQVKPSTQGGDVSPVRSMYDSPNPSPVNGSPQRYSFDNAPSTYDPQQGFAQRQGYVNYSYASPFMQMSYNHPSGSTGSWNNQGFQSPPVWNNQGGWVNTSPVHFQAMMNNVYSARHGNNNITPPRTPQSNGRKKRY